VISDHVDKDYLKDKAAKPAKEAMEEEEKLREMLKAKC